MVGRWFIVSLALIASASCTDFPKDPRGTLDRVRGEGSFRVGLVSSAAREDPEQLAQRLVDRIGKAARASPQMVSGETEVLLTGLEEGHLDVVIGRFEKKSPWAARVTFGPPLRTDTQGKSQLLLRPAMRNGENGWITLIERQARDLAPDEQ